MGGSFHFRNINTYVYEPEGESVITQPSQASMDFVPSDSRIQSDWEQSDSLKPDFIKNKPTIPEKSTLALKSDLTKESIAGLKIDSSPEFADSNITNLSTEATYTPTVWSYLVGLFTTVPKSVLQHLVKLWGVVNDLAVRVGLLEDNLILELTVTEDTYLVEITQDKNGNPLNLIGKYKVTIIGKSPTALASNLCTIGINDITSNSYYSSYQATGYNGINFRGGTKSLYFDFALTIAGGGIAWNGTSYGVNYNLSNTSSPINGYSLDDVTINSITKLAITFMNGSAVISNGTKIKITRF